MLLGGLLAAVVLFAATGYAWTEAIWPLNQGSEKALARRAQYFWDMKVAGDILGAYQYMSETYRKRVTVDGFSRIGQGLVVHTGAEVDEIEVGDGVATVDLRLKHRFNKKGFEDLETVSEVQDRWVFENGTWYRWPAGWRG